VSVRHSDSRCKEQRQQVSSGLRRVKRQCTMGQVEGAQSKPHAATQLSGKHDYPTPGPPASG